MLRGCLEGQAGVVVRLHHGDDWDHYMAYGGDVHAIPDPHDPSGKGLGAYSRQKS